MSDVCNNNNNVKCIDISNKNTPKNSISELSPTSKKEDKSFLNDSSLKIININDKKRKKKKSLRCSHPDCKKKLSLMDLQKKCKCEKQFCMSHFSNNSHNCQFDYAKSNKELLEKRNPKCEHAKIIRF